MLLESKCKIEEHLSFSHDNALEYKCSESTIEDWLDTPEINAKLIVELQRHSKAVAEHLASKETLETTETVRDFTEAHIKNNEKTIQTIKTQTATRFKDIFKRNEVLEAYVKNFEEGYIGFCKTYTADMEVQSLRDLVPELTAEDVAPDTEGMEYVIRADPRSNKIAGKARTFTLDQL